jgi:hypothetical protein
MVQKMNYNTCGLPETSEWSPQPKQPLFINRLGMVIKDEIKGVYKRNPANKLIKKSNDEANETIHPVSSGLIKWR